MADESVIMSTSDIEKATSNYEHNTHLLLDDNNDSPVIILERDQYGRSKPHRIAVLLKKNILNEKQCESVHDLPLKNASSLLSDGEDPLNNKRSLDFDDCPDTKKRKNNTDSFLPSCETLITLSRGKSFSDPSLNHFDSSETRSQFECGRYNESVYKSVSMSELTEKVHNQNERSKLINKKCYTNLSSSDSLISSLETTACIHSLESTNSSVSQQISQQFVLRDYLDNDVAVGFYVFIVLIMLVIMFLPNILNF